jgi:hypothetical protein
MERTELVILQVDQIPQSGCERVRFDEVRHPESQPRGLVRIGRSNSAQRRADFRFLETGLLHAIQLDVIGQDDVRPGRDLKAISLNALAVEKIELVQEADRIEHDAGADDALALGIEDAGRHQVHLERAPVGGHRMTGVAATVGADHHV